MIALRPLSFGELFDRAITIGIRNAWPVTLCAGVPLLVAYAVSTFFVTGVATYGRLWLAMHHHVVAILVVGPSPAVRFAVLACLSGIGCFVTAATAAGVAQSMEDRRFDAKVAARSAFACWQPIVGLAAIALVVHLPLDVAGERHWVAAEWILLPIDTWLSLLLSVAVCVVVIERSRNGEAIRSAIGRIAGVGIGRSIAIAAAFLVFYLLGSIVEGGLGTLAFAANLSWSILPTVSIIDAVLGCFVVLVITVYYFDLRVRREGLGLL